uniref:Uncharacterized protein n=1 Tax=Siphoviridae sp. ctnpt50 TaxID=2827941 RepID=A0A8S5SDC6_9CAUD|nr:MAG TPA: hypothetical protein [Siphoviridae sp. ctnpt50]
MYIPFVSFFQCHHLEKEVIRMAEIFVYVIVYQNLSGVTTTYTDAFRLRKDAEKVAKQLRACEYERVDVRKMRLI